MASVGCLLVPRFPLAVELASCPDLCGRSVVVAHPHRPEVGAVSPEAEALGVRLGQPLSEAIGCCPELEVLDARPARYAAVAEEIATALEQVAAGMEPAGEGLCFIDLRGLVAVHGGEAAMRQALLDTVPRVLGARFGMAASRFTALLAARSAAGGEAVVVSAEQTRRFLSAQLLQALDAEPAVIDRLRLLGFQRLGDLACLDAGLLAAQFGPIGERLWRCSRGEDHEPVRPRRWQEQVMETLDLESPLTTREPLRVAVEHLLARATQNEAFRGRAVRQLQLTLLSENDRQWQRTLTFREALTENARIAELLRSSLAEIQMPGPVVRIVLQFSELVWARAWQTALLSRQGDRRVELEEGLRKLRSRYGHCLVERIVEVEPWNRIPERRRALTSFTP